jgi:hypothetical protein
MIWSNTLQVVSDDSWLHATSLPNLKDRHPLRHQALASLDERDKQGAVCQERGPVPLRGGRWYSPLASASHAVMLLHKLPAYSYLLYLLPTAPHTSPRLPRNRQGAQGIQRGLFHLIGRVLAEKLRPTVDNLSTIDANGEADIRSREKS